MMSLENRVFGMLFYFKKSMKDNGKGNSIFIKHYYESDTII